MNAPRVWVRELYTDSGSYTDDVFRNEVRSFMDRMMPHFPLGLLEVNDNEKWEVLKNNRSFVPEEVQIAIWTCEGCKNEYFEKPETSCCEDEEFEEEELEGFIIRDYRYSQPTFVTDLRRSDRDVVLEGVKDVAFFDDETEAQEEADRLFEEEDNDSYGFPWANNTAYIPDSYISTESLQSAGFVVANYTGGDECTYRLCGVDGGGYSFEDHFVRLLVAHYDSRDITVLTTRGHVHVTFEDVRDPLIRLGEIVSP